MKVELHPTVEKYRGKIGKLTYRVMYGKQTVMKTPDTPALARRCKCVQRQVEQGPEGRAQPLCRGHCLRQASHGRPEGPCTL